jgi:hypothetical protein
MQRSKGSIFTGAVLLALLSWGAARASEVAIHSIVAAPTKFDHQNVTLVGSITDLKETTSRAGNDYTTFKLQDPSGDVLTIFVWGHPALRNGVRVSVDGVFETEHHAGRYTFYNEVEATKVTPSP